MNKLLKDAIADANFFDISLTSVATLQGLLNSTPVVTIDQAIETLRQYCPGCYPQLAIDTLVANKFTVAGRQCRAQAQVRRLQNRVCGRRTRDLPRLHERAHGRLRCTR